MNTSQLFVTQATLSLLSFGRIARWSIYPCLRDRSLRDALTPLLLFETLRTIGLIVLVPGLVDAALPAALAIPAAIGDLLAVVLAFEALVAVRSLARGASARLALHRGMTSGLHHRDHAGAAARAPARHAAFRQNTLVALCQVRIYGELQLVEAVRRSG